MNDYLEEGEEHIKANSRESKLSIKEEKSVNSSKSRKALLEQAKSNVSNTSNQVNKSSRVTPHKVASQLNHDNKSVKPSKASTPVNKNINREAKGTIYYLHCMSNINSVE